MSSHLTQMGVDGILLQILHSIDATPANMRIFLERPKF